MKKWIKYILLFILLLYKDVSALTINEIKNRTDCPNGQYGVGSALVDGSLTNISCYLDYNTAKTNMKNDDQVIIYYVSGATKIIDANYAIAKLDRGVNENTNIYTSSSLASAYTYMNNYSSYGGVDGAFSGYDHNYKSAKITISAYTGYVNEASHKLVPLNWVKSTNIYYVTQDIKHCFTTDIEKNISISPTCYNLGPKPPMLVEGTYYSYDGRYFYNNRQTMLNDYRNNTNVNAYNANNPYYNYYMWLPFHSKSRYSANDLDNYIRNTLNYIGKTYGFYNQANYSMFYGEGATFYESQEYYGINMLATFGIARNESTTGRSDYAINRNNIFGHNAPDANPDLATYYLNIRESIYNHAQSWMTYWYAEPTRWVWYGSMIGNKSRGANVKYASDPYWGEKAAAYYYDVDKSLGMLDYNYYQIGITNTSSEIFPKEQPNPNSPNIYSGYKYNISEAVVLIIDEIMGTDGKLWYKIMSDVNQNANRVYIQTDNLTSKYNWDYNYAYVPAEYFKKINNKENYTSHLSIYNYNYPEITYTTYHVNRELKPKLGNIKQTTTLYYSSLLDNSKNMTIPAHSKVIVHEAASVEGKIISYLITYEYSKTQKEWVNANDVEIIDNAIVGKTTLSLAGDTQNIRLEPSTSSSIIGSLPSASYVGVIADGIYGGLSWAKIYYNNGVTGWIVTNYDGCFLSYDAAALKNNFPVINASDKVYLINSIIDYKKEVTAIDIEDGDITSHIEIISNNVNPSVVGVYQVTYKVVDSNNNTTTKTINITISDYIEKEALTSFQSFTYKSGDIYEVSGLIVVSGMNNNSEDIKQTFILRNMDTKEDYRFPLTNWKENYPFEFSNVGDDKPYDYSKGWFKSDVDLSSNSLPQGDYIAYVEITNGVYKASRVFHNLSYKPMTKRQTLQSGRGIYMEMNYFERSIPLNVSIRDNGLISDNPPINYDIMFNFFNKLEFVDEKLYIRGTSHNVGIDYNVNNEVVRTLILENNTTYERFTYDIGSISTGDYVVTLRATDGLDKTRVWYDANIDIKDLPKGTYTIYIKTQVGSFSDYGPLTDLSYRTFNSKMINDKNYIFQRIDSKRFRIELVIN